MTPQDNAAPGLEPCPFCGGTNLKGCYDQENTNGVPCWYECQTCFTQGPIAANEHEADERWNQRSPSRESQPAQARESERQGAMSERETDTALRNLRDEYREGSLIWNVCDELLAARPLLEAVRGAVEALEQAVQLQENWIRTPHIRTAKSNKRDDDMLNGLRLIRELADKT